MYSYHHMLLLRGGKKACLGEYQGPTCLSALDLGLGSSTIGPRSLDFGLGYETSHSKEFYFFISVYSFCITPYYYILNKYVSTRVEDPTLSYACSLTD